MSFKKYNTIENGIEYEIREYYGSTHWYRNGELDRESGPAKMLNTGSAEWYRNGKLHRLDGPALDRTNMGETYWFYHGELIECETQEEFERYLRLKAFW